MADASSAYTISVVVDSDTAGLSEGADHAAAAIGELGSKAAEAGGAVDEGMSAAGEAAAGLGESAAAAGESVAEGMTAATEGVQALTDTADEAVVSAASVTSGIGELSDAGDTMAAAMETSMTDAGDAISSLGDTASTTSLEVAQSLETDIPQSAETAAIGLTTKAGKFKAVGTQLGTQLASGVAGGIEAPQAIASSASSLSGLLALAAKTPTGIAVAAGVGLAGALITGLTKTIGQGGAEFNAAVNDLLGNLEGDFRGQINQIMQDLRSSLTEVAVLTKLGGDAGLTGGLAEAKQQASLLGVRLEDIVRVLEGKTDPATQALVDHWRAVGVRANAVLDVQGELNKQQGLWLIAGKDVVEQYDEVRGNIDQAKSDSQDLHRSAQALAFESSHYAGNMERAAAAAAQTAQSASVIGHALRGVSAVLFGRGSDYS